MSRTYIKKFHICPHFMGGDAIVCINIKGIPFLYCDSGFIQCARLSDRIFSISSTLLSILSVPIISNVLAGISIRIKSSFFNQGDWSPLGSLRGYMSDRRASGRSGETTVGDQCDGLYQLRIGGDRFLSYKTFSGISTSFSVLHNG